MNLETELENNIISFTGVVSYQKPTSKRPQPVNSLWNQKHNCLFVSLRDREYKEIAEEVYNELMKTNIDFWHIPKGERATLYNHITSDMQYRYIKGIKPTYLEKCD